MIPRDLYNVHCHNQTITMKEFRQDREIVKNFVLNMSLILFNSLQSAHWWLLALRLERG